MLNLNEKYFTIREPRGRNHQNKFCLRPLKRRFYPWELKNEGLDYPQAENSLILRRY